MRASRRKLFLVRYNQVGVQGLKNTICVVTGHNFWYTSTCGSNKKTDLLWVQNCGCGSKNKIYGVRSGAKLRLLIGIGIGLSVCHSQIKLVNMMVRIIIWYFYGEIKIWDYGLGCPDFHLNSQILLELICHSRW